MTRFAKGDKFVENEVAYKHQRLVNFNEFLFIPQQISQTLLYITKVQQQENAMFLEEYLAQFCEKLPGDAEVED